MGDHGHEIDWARYDAVLFDLDGVVTPTAAVHERAWAALFEDYDYTPEDYLTHIDGRPRYDGVRTFLASRGVVLPEGQPTDPPGAATIVAMGNRKDDLFRAVLDTEGVSPYPGTVALLEVLDELGVAQAIVSSSRNAGPVLEAAGLSERFTTVVDGLTLAEDDLPGKPAPDMFLLAASRLGADPGSTVVVEDASSGVAAGRAGEFALVIGVDRGGNREALLASGADVVVEDLADTLPEGSSP